ncbi:MAG TPA: hypothetical protein DHW71_02455 [Gammaproteobacteria bacterium]|nr:hypothetical protein [Gammaproteobacteria bacterium]HBF08631.1 hypothetical protein [Gammaproteobacteria bacterium]HCK91817.1 hypothetical protein [Gammaproteobacteria bacterium]|tara:strand:- start:279 stop:662 length:384 start_codon:yes stop_codon:yes gene_type:complete
MTSNHTERPVQTKTLFQKIAIAVFYISIIVLIYLATSHQTPIVKVSYGDKIQHIAAFGWLTLVSFLGWRQHWFKRFIIVFGFSICIEVAQSFLSYRSSDWHDLVANTLGILATEVFVISYLRKKLSM